MRSNRVGCANFSKQLRYFDPAMPGSCNFGVTAYSLPILPAI